MLLSEVSIPVLTVIIAGVVTIISAVSAAVVVVIKALRERDTVLQTVSTSVAKIEGHVNSEKTAATEQARAKDREIELLREMLAQQKQTAALLAQSTAAHTRGVPLPETS
jgi:hypothetical protein